MAEIGEIPAGRMVVTLMAVCIVSFPAHAKYSGGSGTAQDPWRIANKKDLLALAVDPKDYAAHLILTADISLAQQSFTLAVIAPCLYPVPQREFVGTPFTGTFDGNGHKITDLKIDGHKSAGYLGLFGCVAQEGVVKNLRLERVSVAAALDVIRVGLLVGFNNGGTILDCSVAGDITATDGHGADGVGALAGQNGAGGMIRRCHTVAGTIRANDNGGSLVGNNDLGARITECSAAGKVVGDSFAGGLVAWNKGRIDRCEATGDTTSGSALAGQGGLVGLNEGIILHCQSRGRVTIADIATVGGLAGANTGTIIDCQSTGDIDGNKGHDGGGFVGFNRGLIANCRATGGVSRRESASGSGGAVGRNGGVIMCCCATGSVSGSGVPIGGLVGTNDPNGTTLNCYASGNVTATLTVGGLAGSNEGAIANCYAVGKVTSGGDPLYYPVGGLTARGNAGGQAVGSFWDIQTTGQSKSVGGTGKTTAEMKTARTFLDAAWDFTCIWNIVEKQSYPFLRFNPEADLNGDQKVNLKDFARLAAHWSKSCTVSADPKHSLSACFLGGDLNCDKTVDARDLWLMALQWLDSRGQNVVQ